MKRYHEMKKDLADQIKQQQQLQMEQRGENLNAFGCSCSHLQTRHKHGGAGKSTHKAKKSNDEVITSTNKCAPKYKHI